MKGIYYRLGALFIILICILLVRKYILSTRVTYDSVSEHFTSSKPIIWMYWENVPGKSRPPYLDLCYKSVLKNCSHQFTVILITADNVYEYLPHLRTDLDSKLPNIPMKTDYIRYQLMYHHGGIWLDFDTIVVKDIYPVYELLEKYDFVGFGCYYRDQVCLERSGYPNPANWALMSRRRNALFGRCVEICDNYLDNYDLDFFQKNYHLFGKDLLPKAIIHTEKTRPNWKYYHFPSKCLERDSTGTKTRNHILVSNADIDPNCSSKYYFIPIYNTAPGFPQWFRDMSVDQILSADLLISKMYRLALT
jgi:hypothetical protein